MLLRKTKIAEGSLWIAWGGLICLLGWKEELGSISEPGPGFLCFLSGCFIAGAGSVIAISESVARTPPPENDHSAHHSFYTAAWPRLLYTVLLLLMYAVLFNTIGYIVTTFLALWGLFLDWENKNWISSFLASLLTTGVTYIVFEVWLRCQFPHGIFPWW